MSAPTNPPASTPPTRPRAGEGGGGLRPALRRLAGGALAAGLLAGLALCSSLPLPGDAPAEALLLLDWRLRGEEAGGCVRPTEAELEQLPPHMRNPDACAGGLPAYRLRVRVDGEVVLDRVVRGGGVRGDRPLVVYDELTLAPGERSLAVEFEPEEEGGDEPGLRLATDGVVELAAGQVLLAVRRQDTGELVLRAPVR